jgi:Skp family chaperone for outer membrane proteins
MFGRILTCAVLTIVGLAPVAQAQQQPIRVAVCNPNKVIEQLEERKTLEADIKAQRDAIQVEYNRRKAEADRLTKERDDLSPTSTLYKEKSAQLMQKAVEFEVWARLQEAQQTANEKVQIKAIFDKISDGVKAVAEQKKIDLVITEQKPQLPDDLSKLTADQVRGALNAVNVLYKNTAADISDDVALKLNSDFKKPKP